MAILIILTWIIVLFTFVVELMVWQSLYGIIKKMAKLYKTVHDVDKELMVMIEEVIRDEEDNED